MSIYNTPQQNEVSELQIKYAPLLDAAPTFKEYKRLESSLEKQIQAVYGLTDNKGDK